MKTPWLYTDEHHAAEQRLADQIEARWRCTVHRFPHFSPIDFYLERDGTIKGFVEVKVRTARHRTVFLAVRKWLALMTAQTGLAVPGLFVAGLPDETRWIRAQDIDTTRVRIAGRTDRALDDDLEPMLDVVVDWMHKL